jgi:hypothetical protein
MTLDPKTIRSFVEQGSGLRMDIDKWYLLSDSGSSYVNHGFSSSAAARAYASEGWFMQAYGLKTSDISIPKFKSAFEGWDDATACCILNGKDLLDFWQANIDVDLEPSANEHQPADKQPPTSESELFAVAKDQDQGT